jgi:hypothetical protein
MGIAGSRDRVKRTSASISEIATRDALAFMQTNDMQIFEGDSVAFLITVYRNERLPLRERMAAAMAVSPYERARLTAVDMRNRDANGNSGWNPDWNDEDAGEKLIRALRRRIEVRRQEEHEAMIRRQRPRLPRSSRTAFITSQTFFRVSQLRRHHRGASRMLLTSSRQSSSANRKQLPPLSQQLRLMRFR